MRSRTGTEGAFYPFWSPDSRSIGFFAGTALKRLDLGGGAPQTLASSGRGRGGMWTADGFIVFSPGSGPLRRVSATGGQATSVTTLGPKIASHRFPVALPDGRRFLFYAEGVFLPSGLGPAEASREGGWLLWVRAGALVAQQLDVTKTRILVGGADTGPAWQYDVAPDGRFLINNPLDIAAAPITLIQNWQPDAKK